MSPPLPPLENQTASLARFVHALSAHHLLDPGQLEEVRSLSRSCRGLGALGRAPLPVAQACDFVRQAARGLQHAFERGVVHRDIKPTNLLLTRDGVVKVVDFGLARLREMEVDATNPLTGIGQILGTMDYIAPEQATNPRSVDIRADLYALGCTLYFLLSGRPLFQGGSPVEK